MLVYVHAHGKACIIMPCPVRAEALSNTFVLRLSVAYFGNNLRTERPRKTKIGTQVAHVTHNSGTTFKVQRSKIKVTRPVYSPWHLCTGSCSSQHGNILSVGNCCYVSVCRRSGLLSIARRYGAHMGGEGWGHIVSPLAQLAIVIKCK